MLTSVGIYAAQHVDVLDIMSKQLIMFLKLIFWPYLTHRPLNCTFIVGSYKETQIYKGGKKTSRRRRRKTTSGGQQCEFNFNFGWNNFAIQGLVTAL